MASEVGVYDVDPKDVLLKVGEAKLFTKFKSIETFIDIKNSPDYMRSTMIESDGHGNHKYIKLLGYKDCTAL
jgi:hypothetical protein